MIDHIISIVMFWCPDECYVAFWPLILDNYAGEVQKISAGARIVVKSGFGLSVSVQNFGGTSPP